jgi:hypothetical protein
MAALPLLEKYKPYYDEKFLEFMQKNQEQFKEFEHLKNGLNSKNTLISEVFSNLEQQAQNLLRQKKNSGRNLFNSRRKEIEKVLDLSEFKALKDRYENIRECELTPIN